ncbi:MAG: helix-turn-helix domain-containing protein [Terriglobia bacterium]
MSSQLLTLREAAALLGVSLGTMRQWRLLRKIEFIEVGGAVRVKPSTIDNLITAGTVPAREVSGA